MNKYVMVLSYDWADEFTAEALQIATLEEINSFKNRLNKFKDRNLEGLEIYYGTNEFITFDRSKPMGNQSKFFQLNRTSKEFHFQNKLFTKVTKKFPKEKQN